MKVAGIKHITLLTGLLLVILIGGQWGLGQQPPRPRDSLRVLRVALREAGAPALTGQQEDALRSLLVTYRLSRRPQQQILAALQAARRAYDEAIVAGDSATAKSQASIIANQTAALIGTTLQDEADVKVGVINILKQNDDQLGLLVKRFGTGGVARLLNALLADNGLAAGGLPGTTAPNDVVGPPLAAPAR